MPDDDVDDDDVDDDDVDDDDVDDDDVDDDDDECKSDEDCGYCEKCINRKCVDFLQSIQTGECCDAWKECCPLTEDCSPCERDPSCDESEDPCDDKQWDESKCEICDEEGVVKSKCTSEQECCKSECYPKCPEGKVRNSETCECECSNSEEAENCKIYCNETWNTETCKCEGECPSGKTCEHVRPADQMRDAYKCCPILEEPKEEKCEQETVVMEGECPSIVNRCEGTDTPECCNGTCYNPNRQCCLEDGPVDIIEDCPTNMYWNTEICACECEVGEESMDCPSQGRVWNPNTCECDCPEGKVECDGECKDKENCPSDQIWDENTCSCVCASGKKTCQGVTGIWCCEATQNCSSEEGRCCATPEKNSSRLSIRVNDISGLSGVCFGLQ